MAGQYHTAEIPGERTRVVLVSGATGAIGKAIARQIAAQDGYAVILLGRDEQKSREALREVREASGNDNVWYELADISRKASIFELAGRWPGRLDVLINNAAVAPRTRQETPEGIELQLATNVLGYIGLAQAFDEPLRQAAPARVVNVASFWAGGLLLNDLEFKRRRYTVNDAYKQSKQADRMITAAMAERLRPHGVTVNACHPGNVDSRLRNNLGFGENESADQGARTPVWLATSPDVAQQTGKYYKDCQEVACRFVEDKTAVEKLYEACLRY